MTRAVLLDENFPRDVAQGLVAAGHDVLSIAVVAPGISDPRWCAYAAIRISISDSRCMKSSRCHLSPIIDTPHTSA